MTTITLSYQQEEMRVQMDKNHLMTIISGDGTQFDDYVEYDPVHGGGGTAEEEAAWKAIYNALCAMVDSCAFD